MKVKNIPLDNILIEDRFRQDLGDIKNLAESIKEKGLIQPISVDQNNKLLAGGRRVAAAKLLELKVIPAVIRTTDDEIDAREVELYENLHRKDMTWQEKIKLTAKIHDLLNEKYKGNWSQRSTAKLLGKSKAAVNDAVELSQAFDIIPDLEEMPTADSARKFYKRAVESAFVAEALKEAKTKNQKRAIIWASDHYQVADFHKRVGNIADGVMHFAEVDPPYGIDLKAQRKNKGENLDTYNEIDKKDYPEFLRETAKQVYRVLQNNSFCIWWFGPTWQNEVLTILRDCKFHVDEIPAIWYKPGGGVSNNPNTYLARSYEPFYICRKGNPALRFRGRSNVFTMPGVPPAQRIHTTERPVELMQELIRTFVYPGARIIVPFLGSGNTIIAAYKEGLVAFGYDLSQKHKEGFLVRVEKEFPKDFNPEEQRM